MIRASLLFIAPVLALATLSTTACKKKEEGKGGDTAKAAAVKLPKVGLQLDAPGEVSVEKQIGGDGDMLTGSGIGAMTVELAKTPQSLDEAKSDAGMYSPKNLKEEKLSDGYALTYENKGSMGANYFVDVRRDLDGKTYHCSTTGSDPAQAAAVLAACKSLRK